MFDWFLMAYLNGTRVFWNQPASHNTIKKRDTTEKWTSALGMRETAQLALRQAACQSSKQRALSGGGGVGNRWYKSTEIPVCSFDLPYWRASIVMTDELEAYRSYHTGGQLEDILNGSLPFEEALKGHKFFRSIYYPTKCQLNKMLWTWIYIGQ